MSEALMEKARELGRELARSREITEMHEAERAMLADPAAGAVVREFNEMKNLFDTMAGEGRRPDAKQSAQAADIEARAEANPLIARFMAAQKEVEVLLERINEEIGAGLVAGDGR